ncbi:hypothetical protein AYK24_06625 [Thermoplasmatales archaeon SG8-52-4]|nr:MAG: hypothetical protein AYK24_06625 [Thermoplasmatales archaeon SG8-52-4]
MAIKRRNKDKSDSFIIKDGLLKLLRCVHLGGVIEDCLLEVNRGVGSVMAVDITNSLIIMGFEPVMSKSINNEFGLGNIDLLIRFLSSLTKDKNIPIKTDANHLKVSRKDGKRRLDYLLTDPSLIGTKLSMDEDDEDPYKKIKSMMEYSVPLNASFTKDFLSYIGMLSTPDTRLKYSDESISFICGADTDHQMELSFDAEVETIDDAEDDVSLLINGEHLSKIFQVLDIKDEPILYFAQEAPIMIESDKVSWALTPISGGE